MLIAFKCFQNPLGTVIWKRKKHGRKKKTHLHNIQKGEGKIIHWKYVSLVHRPNSCQLRATSTWLLGHCSHSCFRTNVLDSWHLCYVSHKTHKASTAQSVFHNNVFHMCHPIVCMRPIYLSLSLPLGTQKQMKFCI